MKKLVHRKFCLIIISLILFSTHIQAQNGWTKKADLPIPRVGASAGLIDGKIYVFGTGGCYSSCHNGITVNIVYDPAADTWDTTLAPLPTARGFFSTAVVNDTIYTLGGGYPTLAVLLRVVEAYAPTTNAWTRKADMLSPRFGAQATVVDGIIYNIGGNYGERNCEAYNPSTNEWTAKTPIPPGSGGELSVTECNGLIYAFGGSTLYSEPCSTVYSYDWHTDTWTRKADMPTARFALQTYLVEGKIYAIGGSQAIGISSRTVEVYNTSDNTWVSKPDMPDSLAWFGGAVVGSKIYVIGGTTNFHSAKLALWEYDPLVVSVEQECVLPTEFVLHQNYPNPFNPSTKIKFQIVDYGLVTLKVYDILGNEIATLVNEEKPAGEYEVMFDSHSGNIRNLQSGVYFYQLKTGNFIETKKMILIR